MSGSRNPATILYDGYGTPLAVLEDNTVFSDQPGLIFAGKDENGLVRFVSITSAGAINTVSTPRRNVDGDYYACTSLISGSKLEQILATIENPASSGKTIYISKIEVNGVIDTKFSTAFLYKVGRTVTLPSGGVILSEQLRKTSDASAVGIVREEPSAVADSGSIWVGSPGVLTKHGQHSNGIFKAVATFNEDKEIVLLSGESIVVIAEANDESWEHWVTFQWNEVT